jgi:hypothetical protein
MQVYACEVEGCVEMCHSTELVEACLSAATRRILLIFSAATCYQIVCEYAYGCSHLCSQATCFDPLYTPKGGAGSSKDNGDGICYLPLPTYIQPSIPYVFEVPLSLRMEAVSRGNSLLVVGFETAAC